MKFRLEEAATLLVVKSKPLLSEQMKLTDTSDLTPFKSLLISTMFVLDFAITLSTLLEPIETTICFLDSFLVVMLSLGFSFCSILLMTL